MKSKTYELKRASQRLRTIEAISKYREAKIKNEFDKMEQELENEKKK